MFLTLSIKFILMVFLMLLSPLEESIKKGPNKGISYFQDFISYKDHKYRVFKSRVNSSVTFTP
jgi:hypothetical protein